MLSKRNKILAVCAIVLYLGTILFSVYRKNLSGKEDHTTAFTNVPATRSAVLAGETISPVPEGHLPEEKDSSTKKEFVGLEELYPEDMDVSSVPKEILEMLHVTEEELSERIRIFANGQGMAAMDKVSCQGDFQIDQDNHTVSVTLYFASDEADGITENNCYFDYIYYEDTDDYRIDIW